MKNILVVKGEIIHHPLLFCKIFLVSKAINSIGLTGSLKCTSLSQISKVISCTPLTTFNVEAYFFLYGGGGGGGALIEGGTYSIFLNTLLSAKKQ